MYIWAGYARTLCKYGLKQDVQESKRQHAYSNGIQYKCKVDVYVEQQYESDGWFNSKESLLSNYVSLVCAQIGCLNKITVEKWYNCGQDLWCPVNADVAEPWKSTIHKVILHVFIIQHFYNHTYNRYTVCIKLKYTRKLGARILKVCNTVQSCWTSAKSVGAYLANVTSNHKNYMSCMSIFITCFNVNSFQKWKASFWSPSFRTFSIEDTLLKCCSGSYLTADNDS